MKLLQLTFLSLLFASGAYAQRTEIIKINTQSSGGALYKKGYLYETFTDGKLFYKDGSRSDAKFNLNGMTNEMLFVSPQGDTLKLARPETAAMITIGTDTFSYFDNTFLKKVTHDDASLHVYEKQELKFVNSEVTTPYGSSGISSTTVQGGAITGLGGAGRTGSTAFGDTRVLVFKKSVTLYIVVDKNRVYPSKQSSFYKMFPGDKDKINAFVKEQKIDFSSEEDVSKLVKFAPGLTK